jgi:hypothetical protein
MEKKKLQSNLYKKRRTLMDKQKQAKMLLKHYFSQLGLKIEGDVAVELDMIVDSIVEAAVAKALDDLKIRHAVQKYVVDEGIRKSGIQTRSRKDTT